MTHINFNNVNDHVTHVPATAITTKIVIDHNISLELEQKMKLLDEIISKYYRIDFKNDGRIVEILPNDGSKLQNDLSHNNATLQKNDCDKTKTMELEKKLTVCEKFMSEQRNMIVELVAQTIKQNNTIAELNAKNQQLTYVLTVLRCL